jgi:hypothetical protein
MSGIVEFAANELGVTLTEGQSQAISEFEGGNYQQAIWRWGRRAGKSLCGDVLILADVALRDHLREQMRPNEPRVSAIIAPRLDQAQAHLSNIAGMVASSPRLSRLLVTQTTDELTFTNGSVIKAYPCSARGIRGGAWSAVVLDELGHFVTTEEGNAAGDRVLEAALPSLAQFGSDGWLIAISTPLWKSGAFWKLCERAESRRFPYMQSLHMTTAEANPKISTKWLEDRRREDPDTFGREYEARWIDGATSYLESADVIASVRAGIDKLAPVPGLRYVASLDPGYTHDNFAMGIAHKDPEDGRTIVDGCWTWKRHGHEATLDAITELAGAYRVSGLTTDQHCAVPIKEGLARRQIAVTYMPWTNESKSNAFSWLKIALNTASIEIPDDSALVEELCSLEARPTPSGLTRIAAAGAGHDDRAMVVAAVAAMLKGAALTPAECGRFKELNASLRFGLSTRNPSTYNHLVAPGWGGGGDYLSHRVNGS